MKRELGVDDALVLEVKDFVRDIEAEKSDRED